MLSMSSLIVVVLLTVAVNNVNGNQRVIHVHESSSGEGGLSCCIYGDCSCNSLDHALAHLTNNVVINITTDVMLSSLIKASRLDSVSIIGYNNPTVNCKSGGIHFNFFHIFTIQGITWDGCGKENVDTTAEPGIMLSYSSGITIQNCSFKHSIRQAILISKVTGDVNIDHCNFLYNSHYNGHGAAIYYLSNKYPNFLLKISKCEFSYNGDGKSLVYIENKHTEYNNNIISSSHFCHNQATSIFVAYQKIYLSGSITFLNNTVKQGAGIYISVSSTVTFGKNIYTYGHVHA